MTNPGAAKQYQQVANHQAAGNVEPYKIVQMLLQGAIDKIAVAKGHMAANNVAEKGEAISVSISIIDGLRSSLDLDQGQDIAQNLAKLYDHMMDSLVLANLNNDVEKLDDIASLLKTIKEGWDAIPEFQRNINGGK